MYKIFALLTWVCIIGNYIAAVFIMIKCAFPFVVIAVVIMLLQTFLTTLVLCMTLEAFFGGTMFLSSQAVGYKNESCFLLFMIRKDIPFHFFPRLSIKAKEIFFIHADWFSLSIDFTYYPNLHIRKEVTA